MRTLDNPAPDALNRVAGHVRGNIDADGVLVVEPHATINGDVTAVAVVINGQVRGDVRAALVAVGREGRVVGRVMYGALRTALGAEISGQLRQRDTEAVPPDVRALVEDALQPVATPPCELPRASHSSPTLELSPPVANAAAELPGAWSKRRLRSPWMLAAAACAAAVALTGPFAESSAGHDASPLFAEEPSAELYPFGPVTPHAIPPDADAMLVFGAPLRNVYWKVTRATTLQGTAWSWDIPAKHLAELNPELRDVPIAQGTSVLVHRARPDAPTRTVGRPDGGRLVNGVPMPEGEYWHLRPWRRNYYGTALTIANLTAALEIYGRAFPGAPPVRIGDISSRRGGTLRHHKSHQAGRDVDLGFILLPDESRPETDNPRSRHTTKESFDGEKNWFLVRTLIDGGAVGAIFISARVQKWLRQAALHDLPASSVDEYFKFISHEEGHTRHMHVRFGCAGVCPRKAR